VGACFLAATARRTRRHRAAKHSLTANKLETSTADDLRQKLFAPSDRQAGDFGRRKESRVVLPALPSWSERIGLPAFFTARNHAQGVFAATGTKPKLLSLKNFVVLREDLTYAVRLMIKEKEILLFAALQWLVVGVAYLMWTQVLDWIPDSVWAEAARAAAENRDAPPDWANLAIWGWSLLIIATAAYPLALLNASIVASHYLRTSSQPSTIAACVRLASKNLGRVWLFTAMDALVTAGAILDRLPSKRRRRTAAEEAAYYAWKIVTVGALPSLVAGKSFVDAANESVWLLEDQPVRTIGIRMGYSLVCWIIGVLAYAGAIVAFMMFGGPVGAENWVYHFYVLMGAPIFVAVGITSLLRPLFVIAVAKLYTDTVPVNVEIEGSVVVQPANEIDWPTLLFAVLFGILVALYFTS
jgi:hypothetical protein